MPVATAETPATSGFERSWSRTDLPVLNGQASRTWMWGPEAFTGGLSEPYAEAPGTTRTVQYFDKARMEDNSWQATSPPWDVTSGLLVTELISGRLQLGDNQFENRSPAQVNVAGDADDPTGPTYASFTELVDATGVDVGGMVVLRVSRDGTVTVDESLTELSVPIAVIDDVTNHGIAEPFWDFMGSEGIVYQDGQYTTSALFENRYFATGRPITEPYWANVKVGGVYKDVLLQCFERRCLTYTPDNAPGWQVEAGNVGQHYHRWRYGDETAPPGARAVFSVTYNDEFPAEARSAFEYALDFWSSYISSTVPIEVVARWEPFSSARAGFAGVGRPEKAINSFDGMPVSGAYYPIALANALTGEDQLPQRPDIRISFNSELEDPFQWYFGVEDQPSGTYANFIRIAVHEIGHGLIGVQSFKLGGSLNLEGQASYSNPTIWDTFVFNGCGERLIDKYQGSSIALANELQSNDLFFGGPHVLAANGNRPVAVYAPTSWAQGSSIAHVDEWAFPDGDPDAIMTPFTAGGNQAFGPITIAMLQDLGWPLSREAAAFATARVDRSTGDSAGGSGLMGVIGNPSSTSCNSYAPSLSADGRYVAYHSFAPDLVPGDTNDQADIFVYDRQTGAIERVSVATDGTEAVGGNSFSPVMSGDGRYVVFQSMATNLVADDTNGVWDVFLHDRQTGATTRVSRDEAGNGLSDPSYQPTISEDGRYIAFVSDSDSLVSGQEFDGADVFVYDRESDHMELLNGAANGESTSPAISADGRYVVFQSRASNLVDGDTNGRWDVFATDRESGATERISVSNSGSEGNATSMYPAISADGRTVAFMSIADNLVPGDTNQTWDVFVHDRETGMTELVSVASDGRQGDFASLFPALSADGRYVAFASDATTLVPGDTNGVRDFFIHDRQVAINYEGERRI